MIDNIKNYFAGRYSSHSDAIIISCFFNPMQSPYRIRAFHRFYNSIKHLNHKIVECVIGNNKPQLKKSDNISHVYSDSLLWHKEALLNGIVKNLPKKYKYIFCIDADLLFTNRNWLREGVKELKRVNIIQPFEFGIHLDQDETEPSFNPNLYRKVCHVASSRNPSMWKSFCSNYVDCPILGASKDYNTHGHVGFAWGARREVLDAIPLYDKALIGGADHIIAHAAAGQIPHACIDKSFTDDLISVYSWSHRFNAVVQGKIGYVQGDVYHIWHGDIDKRKYLKRIQEFTDKSKSITEKDKNGLFVAKPETTSYMQKYFASREVKPTTIPVKNKTKPALRSKKSPRRSQNGTTVSNVNPVTIVNESDDSDFLESAVIGYLSDSTLMGTVAGGNVLGAFLGESLRNMNDSSIRHDRDEQPINDGIQPAIDTNDDDSDNIPSSKDDTFS